jgi:hypothetical protein
MMAALALARFDQTILFSAISFAGNAVVCDVAALNVHVFAGNAMHTLNCVPSGIDVSILQPFSPFTAKKCLRSSTGAQPLLKHCSGGHTTSSSVLFTALLLLLPAALSAAVAAAGAPSGSTAVAPGSQGASAVGATPSLHGS